MHFWVDADRRLHAGLSRAGKFVLWDNKGRHDTVQGVDLNEALEVMQMAAGEGMKKENK